MSKFALACAAGAILALTSAFAAQLVLKADHESLVAMRIQGSWKLEAATSDRLDDKRAPTAVKELTFTDNPGVLAGLQAASDRFKNGQIIGSGIVAVDGTAHTYILLAEHAGTTLVWFTGDAAGTNPIATVNSQSVTVALGREPSKDVLFLGGDLRGKAAVAYTHPAPAASR